MGHRRIKNKKLDMHGIPVVLECDLFLNCRSKWQSDPLFKKKMTHLGQYLLYDLISCMHHSIGECVHDGSCGHIMGSNLEVEMLDHMNICGCQIIPTSQMYTDR